MWDFFIKKGSYAHFADFFGLGAAHESHSFKLLQTDLSVVMLERLRDFFFAQTTPS